MNVDGHSVKCPNCCKEFLQDSAYEVGTMEAPLSADEETPKILTLAGEPFPCPNCVAMIKTDRRFRRLAMYRGLAILFALLFAPFFVFGILLPLGYPPTIRLGSERDISDSNRSMYSNRCLRFETIASRESVGGSLDETYMSALRRGRGS